MFLQDNNAGGPNNISDVINNLKSELAGMQSAILNFEIQAKKVSAQTFGQGAEFAKEIRKQLSASAESAGELGVRIDGVAESLNAVSNAFGTNVMLSKSQLDNMIAFQQATNISAESLGKLIEGFATIGVGTTEALSTLTEMRKQANAFGLNTGKFMETVGDNIKLLNSYNFRDGVEGFTRMVARSQALRINMADVKGLAADLLNPEKAIELAANMQMLGGSIAGLSDPFQLMNMAQNDMEGLQNAIIDTASASVTFNEQTGKFNISATEMRRLRAQAQALGMDYEELADTAVKARMKQEAMGQLRFTNLSEKEQEFLSNIGQFEGGELKFKIPGQEELKSATELTSSEIAELVKLSEAKDKSDKELAIEQLTTLQEVEKIALAQLILAQSQIAGSGTYDEVSERLRKGAESLQGVFKGVVTKENLESLFNEQEKLVQGFTKSMEGQTTIGGAIKAAGGYTIEKIGEGAAAAADAVGGPGTAAAIGTAVENAMTKVFTNTPINMNVGGNIGLQAQNIDFSTLTPQQVQDLGNKIKQWMTSNALGNP